MNAITASASPLLARYLGAGVPGAAGSGSLHFRDAEDQALALTGWNQDYLQLSAGVFQGEICQIHGAGIRLFIEQVQQSVFQTGVLPSDVLAVGLPLDASGTGMFCGKACGVDDFHVFSGASGFEFRSSRQHTMLGIELQLEHDWLNDLAGSQDQPGGQELPTQAGTIRMAPAARSELRTYLLGLFQSAQSNPGLLSTPAVVATVADFLLDRMTQVRRSREKPGAATPHWKLVQQACAMAQDRWDQNPTVAQLCVALGVSRRTLQNGFQQVLNVSPLTYLKAVRLDQARRRLKQVSSVTEAATACGFWHFGHFSRDYLLMFGERPSVTLGRHGDRP